jgi:hypothetical protein
MRLNKLISYLENQLCFTDKFICHTPVKHLQGQDYLPPHIHNTSRIFVIKKILTNVVG